MHEFWSRKESWLVLKNDILHPNLELWYEALSASENPLVRVRDRNTSERYVKEVLPILKTIPEGIFQLYNARPHMARTTQECLREKG